MSQVENLQIKNEQLVTEIESLQQELEEASFAYKKNLSEQEEHDERFLTDLHELGYMITELIEVHNVTLKEMQVLREELENLGSLKSDLEQKIVQKQQMILLLQSELSSAEVELVECRSENERMSNEAIQQGDEIQRLKNVVTEFEQKMEETDKQLQDMKDNLMNGSVVNETLELQLAEKKEAYYALEEKYEKLLKDCKYIENKHKKEMECIRENYNKLINEMVCKLHSSSLFFEKNTTDLKINCDEKVHFLETKVKNLIEKVKYVWEKDVGDLKLEIDVNAQQLKDVKHCAEEEMLILRSACELKDQEATRRVKEVENEARIITEKLLRTEEDLHRVTNVREELLKSNMEIQLSVAELKDKVDTLLVENSSLCKSLSEITEERNMLKSHNKKLTVGNRNLNESLEALRVRLLESESDIEEITSHRNNLEKERNDLQKKLNAHLKELETHKISIAEIEAENLQQIESVRKDLLEKLESFKHKALVSTERLQEVEAERQLQIQNLSIQLEMFREEFDELNKYVAAMEQDNEKQAQHLEEFQIEQRKFEEVHASLVTKFEEKSAELEQCSDELSIANDKIKAKEEQIIDYKCQLEQLTVEIETSEARVSELNEALSAVEESSTEHEREIEALTEKLDHQRDCAKIATQQIASLEAKNSYQDHQLKALSSELERHKDFSHQATEHMMSLVNANTEKEHQIELLLEEIDILKTNIIETNNKIEDLQNKLCDEQRRVKESAEEIKLLEGDRFVKEEHIKELTADIERYEGCERQHVIDIAALENIKLEKQEELSEAKFKIIALEGEKATIEQTYKEIVADWEETIHSLCKEKQDLTDKFTNANNIISNLTNIKSDLELKVHELARQCEKLEESITKKNSELESAYAKIEQQKLKLEENNSENSSKMQHLQSMCEDLHKQVHILQNEVCHYKEENANKENAQVTIQELQIDLEEHKKKINRLLDAEKECKEWQKRFHEIESLIGPFKNQLEAYRAECKQLESEKGEVEGEVRQLSLKYAEILGHQNHKQKIRYLVNLQEQNCELKEEVRALKRTVEKFRREAASRKPVVSLVPTVGKGKENVGRSSPVRKSPVASPNAKPFGERPARKNVL